jgi:LacI family transcriptional regulator
MASPTLSDVAQAAGVSYATADRVVNKRGNVAEKSIRKVRDAMAALGYVRNVAAANLSRGRVYRLAFLIPLGPNAFFNRIRDHLKITAERLQTEQIRVEIIEVAAFGVEDMQAGLTALLEQDFDGVAIVGLKSTALEQPLAALRQKGVAIVGLVSDLPIDYRSAYIGIDNRVAGRTAARLIGMAHGGGKGLVQTFAGALAAHDHAERLAGFQEVITADFPKIALLNPLMTKDAAAVVQSQASAALAQHPDLTAVYNVGAGNSGLIAALTLAPRKPFCVVHELVPHTRKAVEAGHIDIVIDQRPDVEINRAFSVLRALIDEQGVPRMPELVPTIYLRDNLPGAPFPETMKDKTT